MLLWILANSASYQRLSQCGTEIVTQQMLESAFPVSRRHTLALSQLDVDCNHDARRFQNETIVTLKMYLAQDTIVMVRHYDASCALPDELWISRKAKGTHSETLVGGAILPLRALICKSRNSTSLSTNAPVGRNRASMLL